jgi:hypothetical protein
MRQFTNLTGKHFGFLRVVAFAGNDRHRRRTWRVECERCGSSKIVLAANLLSGRSRSCGCTARDKLRIRMKTVMLAEKQAALVEKGLTDEQVKEQMAGDYRDLAEEKMLSDYGRSSH